jgi:hypothetical protein
LRSVGRMRKALQPKDGLFSRQIPEIVIEGQ